MTMTGREINFYINFYPDESEGDDCCPQHVSVFADFEFIIMISQILHKYEMPEYSLSILITGSTAYFTVALLVVAKASITLVKYLTNIYQNICQRV